MVLARSLLFYCGHACAAIIIGPLSLLILPLPFPKRYFIVTRWTAFTLWWLKITCGIRYRITGLENIPANPGIVMCKHQSAWETMAIQLIFVPQVWVLKRELLWIPVYGWGLASLRPIAIDRGSSVKSFFQIIRQGCECLRQGRWVIIYPEGTRVAPGEKGEYLPGGGLLAKKSGADVTPVAHNAGYLWSRNAFIKKPGEITMAIGPTISSKGKSAAEIMQEVESWIEQTAAKLPVPGA